MAQLKNVIAATFALALMAAVILVVLGVLLIITFTGGLDT